MKLKTKFTLGFTSVLMIIIFLSIYFLYILNQQNKGMENIIDKHFQNVLIAQDLKGNVQTIGRIVRNEILLDTEPDNMEKVEIIIAENRQLVDRLINQPDISQSNILQLLLEINQLLDEYYIIVENALALVDAKKYEEATELFIINNDDLREEVVEKINKLVEIEKTKMEKVSLLFFRRPIFYDVFNCRLFVNLLYYYSSCYHLFHYSYDESQL